MNRNCYNRILAEFKAKESPEAILLVGEDPCMIRIALAWPNVRLSQQAPTNELQKQWNDVEKWEWLWKGVRFSKKEVNSVVGRPRIDAQLRCLIANRILYPDGTVQSFVVRYLQSRVIKLLEKRPAARRNPLKLGLE